MPNNLKFPPSVEIKRAIAAAIRAGIQIGSIEIYADRIAIHPRGPTDENAPQFSAYDVWKLTDRRDTAFLRHADKESDALPKNSRR